MLWKVSLQLVLSQVCMACDDLNKPHDRLGSRFDDTYLLPESAGFRSKLPGFLAAEHERCPLGIQEEGSFDHKLLSCQ
jgi:hypothetical protein